MKIFLTTAMLLMLSVASHAQIFRPVPPYQGVRAAAPATCTADRGQWYYNSTSDKFQYCSATNTWSDLGGGGGGGLAVGSAVTGGGANRVLFEDGSQNLATSSRFTYASNAVVLAGGNLFDAAISLQDSVGGGRFSLTYDGGQGWANGSGVNFVRNEANNTSGRQFAAAQTNVTPLMAKGMSGQTVNLFAVQVDGSTTDLAGANSTGIWFEKNGAAVASAAAIVPTGNSFHVTGTTSITSITSTGIQAGTIITIIFDAALTFTDGSNLRLAGNFVTTADDTITLRFDGTNWFEMSRAVN